jgi:hypothetical protein
MAVAARIRDVKLSGMDSEGEPLQIATAQKAGRGSVGTRVFVGTVENKSADALLNCVREIVKRHISVSAAYAFMLAVGEGTPSFSIGIYFDHEPSTHEVNELFSKIGYFMRPFLGTVESVDLLSLAPSQVLGFAVKQAVQPFYRRRVQ